MKNGDRVRVKQITDASSPVPDMNKYVGETGTLYKCYEETTSIIFDDPGLQQVQQMEARNYWSWGVDDLELIEEADAE